MTEQKAAFHKVKNFTPGIVATDLLGALATGATAGLNAAIVDKAIMEKTLGKTTSILTGVVNGYKTVLFTPKQFFFATTPPNHFSRVYQLCFTVYCGTYVAGNLTQSYNESRNQPYYLPKFINGSLANVLLTLYKDNELLRILPPPGGKDIPVPNFSRALFVLRDCLTVLAAFWLSDLLAVRIHTANPSLTKRQASDMADVATPAAIQFISTPIHLYAIAYKQHVELRSNPAALLKMIAPQYAPAVVARIGRIVPAFGIGMMLNRRLRSGVGEMVEGPN